MASTPRGLNHPTADDKIKDGSSPSALADDFAVLASSADAAITAGVQEAKDDATTKYGGLPNRVTAVEQKNVQQDASLAHVESRLPDLSPLLVGDYLAVEVDVEGRVSRGVLPDGAQHIPRLRTAHAVTQNFPTTEYLHGSIDINGRMAEDFIGADGRVPQWILDAWSSRMGNSGGGAQEVTARGIICRGDSITAGAFGAGTSYPLELSKLRPHTPIAKRGYPGERSQAIAQRQGSDPLLVTVTGGTIPASGSVAVSLNSTGIWFGPDATQGTPDGRDAIGTVNGIRGYLAGSPGSYTFTRTNTGQAYPTAGAVPFLDEWESVRRDWNQIIMSGYNGSGIGTVEYTAKMVNYQTAGDYLVLSVTTAVSMTAGTPGYNDRLAVNAQLQSIYGERYFDLRGWLITNGLAAVGISPTAEDNSAIAGDTLPPSLMAADGVHPNAAGYTAMAIGINPVITARGW